MLLCEIQYWRQELADKFQILVVTSNVPMVTAYIHIFWLVNRFIPAVLFQRLPSLSAHRHLLPSTAEPARQAGPPPCGPWRRGRRGLQRENGKRTPSLSQELKVRTSSDLSVTFIYIYVICRYIYIYICIYQAVTSAL